MDLPWMLFLPFLLCSLNMSSKTVLYSFRNSKQMKTLSEVFISKLLGLDKQFLVRQVKLKVIAEIKQLLLGIWHHLLMSTENLRLIA